MIEYPLLPFVPAMSSDIHDECCLDCNQATFQNMSSDIHELDCTTDCMSKQGSNKKFSDMASVAAHTLPQTSKYSQLSHAAPAELIIKRLLYSACLAHGRLLIR